MTRHTEELHKVVAAAAKMLPKKHQADRIVSEIKRLEAREAAQSSSSTNGDTEPDESTTPLP